MKFRISDGYSYATEFEASDKDFRENLINAIITYVIDLNQTKEDKIWFEIHYMMSGVWCNIKLSKWFVEKGFPCKEDEKTIQTIYKEAYKKLHAYKGFFTEFEEGIDKNLK